nr:2-dehydropantoate 2-reductase [Halomonas socia]
MRIAIYGTGGVGGYFGGRLAAAGEDVTFIARGDHLAAIQRDGLKVHSIHGDFHVHQAQASEDPASVGPVDLVIVAVKAWQVADAAAAMAPLLGPDTCVLPLENGVEAANHLAREVGADRVIGGLCGILAWREAPGVIRHAGIEPFIRLGELNNRKSERVAAISECLSGAEGMTAEVAEDIQVAIWSKFLFICAMSGIGSISRAPIGVTRRLPDSRALIESILEEIYRVGVAKEVALPEDAVARAMKFIDALPEKSTASMQRDIVDGRPSELESQNGAVVRLGVELDVSTPVNRVIHAALLPQELAAREAATEQGAK